MNKSFRAYKRALWGLLFASVILLVSYTAYYIDHQIPDTIHLYVNEEKTIEFNLPQAVPITGEIDTIEASAIDFVKPVSFKTGQAGEYTIRLKLFGIIDYKDVTINVIEKKQVYCGGMPIGIYLSTNGVLVVSSGSFTDINGNTVCPCEGILKADDYIIAVDNNAVKTKNELIQSISDSKSEPVVLKVKRNNEMIEVKVTPKQDSSGEYKIGAWVRDDTQGIGTLTYITADNKFGALGHGISDSDTGNIIEVSGGYLYNANILSIVKGKAGKPGEFVGSIDYSSHNLIGNIVKNGENGIYGYVKNTVAEENNMELLEVGLKYDITEGEAVIRTYINGEISDYTIKITDIDYSEGNINKGIVFQVTDKDLIAATNGIVQGMSGSPIIQNGKIVGAVTHVFVSDSTKGYGIFIENMLEH